MEGYHSTSVFPMFLLLPGVHGLYYEMADLSNITLSSAWENYLCFEEQVMIIVENLICGALLCAKITSATNMALGEPWRL